MRPEHLPLICCIACGCQCWTGGRTETSLKSIKLRTEPAYNPPSSLKHPPHIASFVPKGANRQYKNCCQARQQVFGPPPEE